MKKYTANQLAKQIADLQRFIATAEAEINNMASLKDRASKDLVYTQENLTAYTQHIPCSLPNEFEGRAIKRHSPNTLDEALEEKSFLEKNSHFVIIRCSDFFMARYDEPDVVRFAEWSKKHIDEKFSVLQAGNFYMSLLLRIAQCHIDLLTDTESLIELAQGKREKHQKRLDKLKEIKPHSKKSIAEGPKNKIDHDDLIKNTLREISRKRSTLKLHLENLSAHRNHRSRFIEAVAEAKKNPPADNPPSARDMLAYNNWLYLTDVMSRYNQSGLSPYYDRINKRKEWIFKTINDIRTLKRKLDKHQAELETYLLESGSEGEKLIRQHLNQRLINFEEQKRFVECADKSTLPFDFFLPDHNLLIEFDGLQHFIPVSLYGGEEGFRDRKRKDAIKTEWAKGSPYRLLRIRYDEFVTEKLDSVFGLE